MNQTKKVKFSREQRKEIKRLLEEQRDKFLLEMAELIERKVEETEARIEGITNLLLGYRELKQKHLSPLPPPKHQGTP